MILCGYVIILLYVMSLIFLVGPFVQKKTNTETSRKFIHTMLFMVWVFIDLFMKNTVHQVILCIIFIILNLLSYKFKIYKSVERDGTNPPGTVYFAIVITIIMSIALAFKDFYYCTAVAVMCLTVGDGFAALIGYNFKSRKIRKEKTLYGFIACFVMSVVSILIVRAVYDIRISVPAVFIVGLTAAIAELIGKGADNFSVVFSSFFLSYVLMYHESPRLLTAMFFALAIFVIVFFSGAISYFGSLLSMVVVFSFSYFGGKFGIAFLLATYFTIFFVSVIKKKVTGRKKGSGRGFLQILINGGLGTLFVILYGIFGSASLMAVSVVAIGGCFVDSLSSDVGVMSRRAPYDPFRRKTVERGISGGMSVLGTACALAASVLIGAWTYFELGLRPSGMAIISALIFAQTLVDSLLGSLVQVKYKCEKCGVITEKKEHCGDKTHMISGVRFINNNMVNLISSVLITIIAAVCLL